MQNGSEIEAEELGSLQKQNEFGSQHNRRGQLPGSVKEIDCADAMRKGGHQ